MRSALASLARSFSLADTVADLRAAGRFFCEIAGSTFGFVLAVAILLHIL